MKRKVKSIKTIQIDHETSIEMKLDVEFTYKNYCVKSISQDKILIQGYSEIEHYDSVNEADRYNRSDYLSICGILCFFTYYPFTVYDFISGSSEIILNDDINVNSNGIKLIVDEIDYSEDLKKILEFLDNEFETTLTVLDRWRKAVFMEMESERATANLYHDEAILIYFNIIELLAEKYSENFISHLEGDIKNFLKLFYKKNFHLSDGQIREKQNLKYNLLKQVLIDEENSVNNKILFMLEQMGIYSDEVKYLVKDLIKCRNQIAHGNISYQKKVIWPYPPFFYLTSDSKTVLCVIRDFAKLIISKHLNFGATQDEEFFSQLLPTKEIVNDFLSSPDKYIFDENDLVNGNKYKINLSNLFYCYVHKMKIKLNKLASAIEKQYLKIKCTEEVAPFLLNISIILADSNNKNVSDKAKENIKVITKNGWYEWSNIKDALRYLELYKTKVIWFKNWIENGEYRS